jgi:hypothetical protein
VFTHHHRWPRIRAGKNSSARKSAKTAAKVIPIKRKGSEINHITGQRTKAKSASGQQNTHNNNQQINVSIESPVS